MDLLITWDAGGTHADVRADPAGVHLPRGAHRLRPDEEYYGIPYGAWRARVGRTVDVLALQNKAHSHAEAITFSTAEPGAAIRPLANPQPYAPPRPRASHPPARFQRPPPSHWADEEEIAVAADGVPCSEYGYHTGEVARTCTREELAARCTAVPATPLVWTLDGVVPPEAVPFLVDELARHRMRTSQRDLKWYSAGLAATLAVYALWIPELGFRSILLLLPAFLAVGVAGALYGRSEARRMDARAFPQARAWVRHAEWLKAQPAHYTRALLYVLVFVFVAQLFAGDDASIQMVGLVKPAVRDGEVWRLLTATLLHANFTHIWMNGGALLATGHLIEVHSRREHVPLVFLVSALAGSVASQLLYPNVTSVGASGGLMGFTGFLVVLGYRRRDALPPGFARVVLFSIAATAVFGLVGFAVIDNAAHLGGLLGGAAVGRVLERRGVIDPGTSPGTRRLGFGAAAVLSGGAWWSLVVMFGH